MAAKPSLSPLWNTGGTDNVEPTGGEKVQGWQPGDEPPAETMNWLQKLTGEWCTYVKEGVIVGDGSGVTGWAATGGGGNSIGVSGTGTGSSSGVLGTGAAASAASGVAGVGGSTSGSGVTGLGSGTGRGGSFASLGSGYGVYGSSATGIGGRFEAASGNNDGSQSAGRGTGAGAYGIGGATGVGVYGVGGSASGAGGYFVASGGNSDGVYGIGSGTFSGVAGIGGVDSGAGQSGAGVYGEGGAIGGGGGTPGVGGWFAPGATGLVSIQADGHIDMNGGTTPAAAAVIQNTLTNMSFAKAFVRASTGATPTVEERLNIKSVVATSSTLITVTLNGPMNVDNFTVLTYGGTLSGANPILPIVLTTNKNNGAGGEATIGLNFLHVGTGIKSDVNSAAYAFSLVVFGEQP